METNNCVLCLDNVIGNKYIEYNHCGRYYLHSHCYDELLLNFKNQCIICRKKVKYINNKFETIETIENTEGELEELDEFNLVNDTNELFNSNQLIVVNETNELLFKKFIKSLCIGTVVIFNFYTVFNLLYFFKLNNLY